MTGRDPRPTTASLSDTSASPGRRGAGGLRPVLHILRGPGAGRVFPLPLGEPNIIVGRGKDTHVRLPDETVSRLHFALQPVELEGGNKVMQLRDLGSRNGTALDGELLVRPTVLRRGARIGLGNTLLELAFVPAEDARWHIEHAPGASSLDLDAITGLPGPDAIEASLPRTLELHHRRGVPISFALLRIDRGAVLTHRWGPGLTELVLKRVGQLLVEEIGDAGQPLLVGALDFGVVLPGADEARGKRALERVRAAVAEELWAQLRPELLVTVTGGVACARGDEGIEGWLSRTRAALRQAQEAGGNRIGGAPSASRRPRRERRPGGSGLAFDVDSTVPLKSVLSPEVLASLRRGKPSSDPER